jgi:hypothetical protein
MATEDNFFTALGPALGPVGAGFRTNDRVVNTTFGGVLEGRELGLFAASSDDRNKIIPVFRTGVWGKGDRVGLYGQTRIPGPDSDSGDIAGVFGTSFSNPGVVGTSMDSFGVVGQLGNGAAEEANVERAAILATSSRNTAVAAVSDTAVAVRAHSGPPHNFGIFRTGTVTATSSGSGIGVSALSSNRDAVRGVSFGSHGVTGYSGANYGLYGLSFARPAPNTPPADLPAGVYGQSMNGSVGVLGVANGTGTAIVGVGTGDANAGVFQGNLFVTGQIFAGIKDAMVPFPDGSKRLLHCMESPEHWFEDFGSTRLARGRVTVKLDAEFAKVVKLNDYRVFLTPEGDCQGLFVRSKGGTSFEVRELQGGTSNVAFSYCIVAKRKDIKAHRRFAKIDTTVPMPTGKPRAARGRKTARLPSSMRALSVALAKDARKKPA